MKKILLILLLIILTFILCACGNEDKFPRVGIYPTHWKVDSILLPLRNGYQFAEVPYGIEETENGYNIIIYCVEEEKDE